MPFLKYIFCPFALIVLIIARPLASLTAAEIPPAAAQSVDFAKDIQPLLEKRCYECHDGRKHKGGIRLDRRADVFRGGDSGKPAVLPRKSAESHLIQLVAGLDPDEIMPPKGEPLTPEQIGLLRAWIDQGAIWPDLLAGGEKTHWAYVPPSRVAPSKVKSPRWVRNPIDAFVLSRLEKEKLTPRLEAERAVLLRRVSLDLTGLPPTPDEVMAFEKDRGKDAYEKAVDRLLASPRYGERWARPWLDLARYADTQGYEKDNRRTMWPYRDWVIDALNRDLPFDQFTIEQLAGDLLPNPTRAQKIATGFHRNTMTNTEGGTDNEEFRYEAVVDRVNTTFAVWMGTTMNCAQCHNHKYDPFTTVEYYRAMAFLNNTEDADMDDERPTMKVFQPGQEEKLAELRRTQSTADMALAEAVAKPEFNESMAAWEKEAIAALVLWQKVEVVSVKADNGTTFTNLPAGDLLATGKAPATDSYTVTARSKLKQVTGFRLDAITDPSLPGKGPGRSPDGNIILTTFKVSAGEAEVKLASAVADFSQDGYPVARVIDADSQTGWAWSPQFGKSHYALFTAAKPLEVADDTVFTFRLEHQNKDWAQHSLGRFRLSVTDAASPTNTVLPEDIEKILATPSDRRDGRQKDRLKEHYRNINAVTKPLVAEAAKSKKAADDFFNNVPITSVMAELKEPRTTHRHLRGAYLQKGEEVTPGVPASLNPFPKDQPPNRLGFARWIVSTNNPLTARVTVNRIWESYFGHGIVETSEDFGTMGEKPSHPELLDWLAMEFMQPTEPDITGQIAPAWSLKHLHRLIVTSATYRQSSKVAPAVLKKDPYNRLFARGPRIRLEAETIRDQALAVAGLLSPKIGGPSVMPPQPDGIWQVVYSGDKWETSGGEDQYRRGLYTFWRRTSPYPSMVSFDAPSREYCVVRRTRSNTPLQALTLLNDPVYVEAAQALARRVLKESSRMDWSQQMEFAFRTSLARRPTAKESGRLKSLYQKELAQFRADPKTAAEMGSGAKGRPIEGLDVAKLAAWTVLANVLLNLDETVTKG